MVCAWPEAMTVVPNIIHDIVFPGTHIMHNNIIVSLKLLCPFLACMHMIVLPHIISFNAYQADDMRMHGAEPC